MLIRTDQATRVLTAAPRIEALLDDVTPRLTVDVHRLDDPEHIVIDTLLAFIHRTIGWAIGRRVPLVFLEMPYETPPFLRYYEAAFGLLPTFGVTDQLLLNSGSRLDDRRPGASHPRRGPDRRLAHTR